MYLTEGIWGFRMIRLSDKGCTFNEANKHDLKSYNLNG